jgi:hypothetical protein
MHPKFLQLLRRIVCLSFLTAVTGCAISSGTATPFPGSGSSSTPAGQYLALLRAGVARARKQMPAISKSADAVAERICAGGTLYVASSDPDFSDELLARAGGLMDLRAIGQAHQGHILSGDVVLYGSRAGLSADDDLKIDRLRKDGAYVIAFASRALSASPYFKPDMLLDSGDAEGMPLGQTNLICPTDSVCNVINAWAWTGEFVAACTRHGKMPICYQSYHLPGGYERAAKYRSVVMFHNDMTIKPVKAGMLGTDYLDAVDQALKQLATSELSSLRHAADWVRDTDPRQSIAMFMAHLYPEHFSDPRTPQPFGKLIDFPTHPEVPHAAVVCVIGYQQAPGILIAAARLHHFKLIYTSVERGDDDQSDSIIYIDPHWPITDGCVHVSGYDIPILPASGVMQAAIYWSIVAQSESSIGAS